MAQEVALRVQPMLGQRMLVVAKTGGPGVVGTLDVKKSPPDGYTLLQAWIGTFVTVPVTSPAIEYDSLRDFTYLAYLTENPVVAMARKDAPYNTLAEFVAHVKANSGRRFTFGGGPSVSIHSISCADTFRTAGINVDAIYYGDSELSLPDLVAGNLSLACGTFGGLKIHEARLKPLGVYTKKRIPQFKDVATIAEQSLGGPAVPSWSGIVAPANLPNEIRMKLIDVFKRIGTDPEFGNKIWSSYNQFVIYKAPGEFRRTVVEQRTVMQILLDRSK
jgi:tripartite-type tricarboxylate transporter receptor subunit TctC